MDCFSFRLVVGSVAGMFHITTNLCPRRKKTDCRWKLELLKLHPCSIKKQTHPCTEFAMAKAIKIVRRSLHAFSRSYQAFAVVAALLVFPASAATLLAQSLPSLSSPILQSISSRLAFLFEAAGFPPSQFFSLLNSKLSQSIFTFVSTLPFTLTFSLLAKASVLRTTYGIPRRGAASLLHLYPSLALTHLFNSLLVLSANAAVLSLLFLAFTVLDVLHLSSSGSVLVLSASGVILYSFVLASAVATCNLSVLICAIDARGGYHSILKTLVLLKGRTATAISLTLPASLGMAAIEALFQYRVVRPYRLTAKSNPSAIWEAFSIVYVHSLLLVLDTIIACVFLRSCKSAVWSSWSKYDHDSQEKIALRV
ncbi:hypothetical protein GW17_00041436 [Ensete ventricosum]|nr:hypothetical protein GW17_00041436 [Ensete ventricosum]